MKLTHPHQNWLKNTGTGLKFLSILGLAGLTGCFSNPSRDEFQNAGAEQKSQGQKEESVDLDSTELDRQIMLTLGRKSSFENMNEVFLEPRWFFYYYFDGKHLMVSNRHLYGIETPNDHYKLMITEFTNVGNVVNSETGEKSTKASFSLLIEPIGEPREVLKINQFDEMIQEKQIQKDRLNQEVKSTSVRIVQLDEKIDQLEDKLLDFSYQNPTLPKEEYDEAILSLQNDLKAAKEEMNSVSETKTSLVAKHSEIEKVIDLLRGTKIDTQNNDYLYVDLETLSIMRIDDEKAKSDYEWDIAFSTKKQGMSAFNGTNPVIFLNTQDYGPGNVKSIIAKQNPAAWKTQTFTEVGFDMAAIRIAGGQAALPKNLQDKKSAMDQTMRALNATQIEAFFSLPTDELVSASNW